ncbi:MAG: S-layer homology domain-containing protein, partial [Thermovirgaceae bacterium]|nr:S-layer homology domain-containing protein [Thermovirgaceae bacterium]
MSRSRFLRSVLILAFALIYGFCGADESLSATRGETIHTVITSLGLPEWSSGEQFTDIAPDHPFSRSIETAAAFGILPPTEQFYPDLEATRAE